MAPDKPNGLENHVDRLNVHMDVQSGGNRREMAANEMKNIRMHQTELQTNNSLKMHEIMTIEPAR